MGRRVWEIKRKSKWLKYNEVGVSRGERGHRSRLCGENNQPVILTKLTVLHPPQSLAPDTWCLLVRGSPIGSRLWDLSKLWSLPESHIYAGVFRILHSHQASGWSLPYFTLILAKSTEVALQTLHSKPNTEFPFKQVVLYEREVVSSLGFPVITFDFHVNSLAM